MDKLGIGVILWLIICISMNGILGWIIFGAFILIGFIIIVIKEQRKINKAQREEDNNND